MTLSIELLITFIVALVCSSMGFYKYVYFISIGYGAAISGQAIAMMFLFKENMGFANKLLCILLFLYGIRLAGYLLIREIKSASYRKHMVTEIKDGSSMSIFTKIMLWVFCALLYVLMISPIFYRIQDPASKFDLAYLIGVIFIVFGILFESLADISKNYQKKRKPKRFCDKGLFAFVRCPNYLGELIIWTGVLICGLSILDTLGQWLIAVTGYVGIVFVMFSGARRLEVRQNKNYGDDPAYQKYVKTVPIMIPFVPLYSVEKYKFLVL